MRKVGTMEHSEVCTFGIGVSILVVVAVVLVEAPLGKPSASDAIDERSSVKREIPTKEKSNSEQWKLRQLCILEERKVKCCSFYWSWKEAEREFRDNKWHQRHITTPLLV